MGIVRLDNMIRIKRASLPTKVVDMLEKQLVFKNPLFYKNQRYGRPNHNIPPTLRCIWNDEKTSELLISRGFLTELFRILHANRVAFELVDLTDKGQEVEFSFSGVPHGYQRTTWNELPKHRFGILVGPIGCGKKVSALNLAAERHVSALVTVTTKRSMYRWKDTAARFLGLAGDDIGLIGDGHRELGRKLTIAITLTLYKVLDQVKSQTGFLIIDDCTKTNLRVFLKASQFNSFYQLGLATSSKRSDGLSRLMHAYLGPKVCEMWPEEGWTAFQGLGKARPALNIRRTGFDYNYQDDFSEMVTALGQDDERNRLIVADILQQTADPAARALVVSERIDHLQKLLKGIKAGYSEGEIIAAETSEKKRAEIFRRFERGKLQVILVTFKSIPTVEVKRATALFISSPWKFDDHLTQIVGKLLAGQGKERPGIFDYMDKVDLLKASLRRRLKVYRSMGAVEG